MYDIVLRHSPYSRHAVRAQTLLRDDGKADLAHSQT